MNANESSQAFGYPPCGSYDAQFWTGWRQDACYPPYYVGNDPSFPCNSSSTLMNHQRFEFPLMHSHHPAFGLPQTIQTLHPSTSSASSVEPTSSTSLPSSHPTERASSSYNSADSTNQPTSSTKPNSEASLPVDSPKDRHSSMKDDIVSESSHVKQEATSSDCTSSKKKRDRFNGLTEEDVLKRTVPDLLFHSLDIIIIGSCPGLTAAYLGHHYAGPGNHFWKCLYLSGLIPEPMNASDDYKLKQFGIGFTNFVARCTKGSVEFSRREIKEGIESLTEKIQTYKPKIAVFNGKGIYEVFCNHKNFYIGKQPEPFPGTNTVVYVMPSSSARCSQLPRASDKVPFFVALRKLRDHLMGCLPHLDESEIVFPDLDLKVEPRKDRRPSEEVQNQSQARPNSRDDRKRKMSECPSSGINDMMVAQRMMYRGFMPHQDFNRWSSAGCFPGWHAPIPLPPSHPHQYSNYDAAFSSMGKVPYTTDPCGFFRNIHPSPFYPGWSPETQHAHHRWAMHPPFPGTSSVPDPRYNISPYFQPFAPADVLSAAALVGAAKPDITPQSSSFPSHFSDSCRPQSYQDPSIFPPEMYPSDQIKSQFQTPAFLQRSIINNPTSSSSSVSYHSSQYR